MAEAHRIPTDRRFIDLTGKSFGRFFVESYAGRRGPDHYWNCHCVCGKRRIVSGGSLKRGLSQSCGCYQQMRRGDSHRTHGRSRTPEYRVWRGMIVRCHHPKHSTYKLYGARGITVCERWRESFAAFYADMGSRPTPQHQIERRKNDGNYEPGNCRWATRTEQTRNRRSNHIITFQGVTLCLKDWASKVGLNPNTIRDRIKRGMSLADALNPKTAERYRSKHHSLKAM